MLCVSVIAAWLTNRGRLTEKRHSTAKKSVSLHAPFGTSSGERVVMNSSNRLAIFFGLCAALCLVPVACQKVNTDRSPQIASILTAQGVSITNSVPPVLCRGVSLKQDSNGFMVFVKGAAFSDVIRFLEAALGDSAIDLGKDIDGFETASFHKGATRPGFLIQGKPNGVEVIGIK